MECVNCGHENPPRALLCYWCGRDPHTGEEPYPALTLPEVEIAEGFSVPEVPQPPPIEVPSPIPVPGMSSGEGIFEPPAMRMPDPPPIVIPSPLEIPEQVDFVIERRRVRHRPVARPSPQPPTLTRPLLPGWMRFVIFVSGLGLLVLLGLLLVSAVGVASLGGILCLSGVFGLFALLWLGLLLARIGRRVATQANIIYDRLEVLGVPLREIAPGVVQELPINLPKSMGVLQLPVTLSELRALDSQDRAPLMERAVDLLTGAIADLVGRDEVILSRQTYPVASRGLLTRSTSTTVTRPVLKRRRVHVGQGELEQRIAQILRTDHSMTVPELIEELVGSAEGNGAQRVVDWVQQALTEHPPDLDALASPADALAELDAFRAAMRRADPELFEQLEKEIRRGLGTVVQRSLPSSVLDLARYSDTTRNTRQ